MGRAAAMAIVAVLAPLSGFTACQAGDEFSGTPLYDWDYEIWVEPDSVTETLEVPFVLSFQSTFEGEVAPEVEAELEYPAFLDDPVLVEAEGMDLSVIRLGDAENGDPMVYLFTPELGQPSWHDFEFRCREVGTGESINGRFVLPYPADEVDLDVPVDCSEAGASADHHVILSGGRARPLARVTAPEREPHV